MTRFARTLDYPEELSWLPDWRDASRYPPVEGTSGTRWAWEFLRRNPDYQKAYLELSRSPPLSGEANRRVRNIDDWLAAWNDLSPLSMAGIDEIRGGSQPFFKICESFRLVIDYTPPDPRSNEDPRLSFQTTERKSRPYLEEYPEEAITVQKGTILIEFDLDLPLKGQLKQARDILKRAGISPKEKYRPEKFPSYLRILDAKTESDPLSFDRIGKIVYPGSEDSGSTASKAHKIALLLRDSLFWKIPLLVD